MDYNFTYREKDGGVQVIVSYKDPVSGLWRQKSRQGFATKREARAAGMAIVETLKTNPAPTVRVTFGEFARVYLDSLRPRVTYNSLLCYRAALRSFSALDGRELSTITYADLNAVVSALPYATATVNNRLVVLKNLFRVAVDPFGLISSSPAEGLRYLRQKKAKKINALTKGRLDEILDRLKLHKNRRAYVACCVAAFAGLRFGEIVGLTWADIDFSANEIRVERQFSRSGSGMAQQPLKTLNSYRTVPLPARLREVLLACREECPDPSPGARVVSIRNAAVNYVLRRIAPGVSIHDLRHTYATLLLASGFDVKTVSALIGDTPAMVLSTYVHYTDDMRKSAGARLADFF